MRILCGLILACGCGGLGEENFDMSNDACLITFSGGLSGALSCDQLGIGRVIGSYDSAKDIGSFAVAVTATAQSGVGFDSIFQRPGVPTVGPWTDADPGLTASITAQDILTNASWQMGSGPNLMKQGSFNGALTDVQEVADGRGDGGNGQVIYSVHGNFQAVMVPASPSGKNTMVSARF